MFHYYASGLKTKPAILFLHGFLGTGDDWHNIISVFSANYYCIAVDLPGHGQTKITGDGMSYTMGECANGIIDILNHLNINSCLLVGYSMGGRLALHLALTYPGLFSRIVLESASPGLKSEQERLHRWHYDLHLAERLEGNSLGNFLDSWYRQPIFSSLSTHPAFPNLKKKRLAQDGKQLASALRAMSTGRQLSLWNKLSKIKLPILLIAGELDFKFSEIMQEMYHLLPQVELKIVEKCGHTVHFEDPDIFVKLIRIFLRRWRHVSSGLAGSKKI